MRILIIRNNSNSQAVDASLLLATYLASQNITFDLLDVKSLDKHPDSLAAQSQDCADAALKDVDLVVALGGDGTILRTARMVAFSGIPILGINFGHLGFLANASDDGVVSLVASALSGEAISEKRTNLCVEVVCVGEQDPYELSDNFAQAEMDESECGVHRYFALNEVALTRGANGRIIDFSLGISGEHVADMRGDGFVVASAIGSTGYALSAGGPLVAPGFSGLVAVPLAPHTLRSRALVTEGSDVVELTLESDRSREDATLFIDGNLVELEAPVKRVYVSRGQTPTTLLRCNNDGFYTHVSHVFF
ncbi:NAD(+)/NADH kinase [Eggerthellaceae bacterium 3-80]|nr:NAD(+)/NADH kinase [bacterium D16-34]